MHNPKALQRAIKIAGGGSALARLIGYSPAAVSNWHIGIRAMSPKSVLLVESATGVPREELYPRLFRRERAA